MKNRTKKFVVKNPSTLTVGGHKMAKNIGKVITVDYWFNDHTFRGTMEGEVGSRYFFTEGLAPLD